jgi:hypothetical protein
MDSNTTSQDTEFSLWTSGHGSKHYKAGCKIQPLDLWTWIPPLQVGMQNTASGPLDLHGFHHYRSGSRFSLWTSGLAWLPPLQVRKQIQPLDLWTCMASTTTGQEADSASGPLDLHGFHHYRSGCKIQPLDLWTSISPLHVRIDASSVCPDMSSTTTGRRALASTATPVFVGRPSCLVQDTFSRLLDLNCSNYMPGYIECLDLETWYPQQKFSIKNLASECLDMDFPLQIGIR